MPSIQSAAKSRFDGQARSSRLEAKQGSRSTLRPRPDRPVSRSDNGQKARLAPSPLSPPILIVVAANAERQRQHRISLVEGEDLRLSYLRNCAAISARRVDRGPGWAENQRVLDIVDMQVQSERGRSLMRPA